MGVLTNILKGKPDSRLRKLADIIGANERDEQWRDELTARQHNLRSQVQAARDTMVENPTAESLERFLEARQAEHATGAFLGEANTQLAPAISRRILDRSVEPVRDAISAEIERLRSEYETIAEQDRKQAIELGVTIESTRSPLADRILAEIKRGQALAARLGEATQASDLAGAIRFCGL
jgi:hypothetical protein